ncbi:hypothetical protein NBRC10513v2_007495 [Rhodotorula toruloides]
MATSTAARTTAHGKRTHAHTLDTPHVAALDDDREEGEIDDDSGGGGVAEGAGSAQAAAVADTGPGRPATTTPALSTSALLAVKEQSKQIIAELLTYGVSPEYLLSVGVSRDILEISFHELNLDLSVPTVAPQAFPYFPPLATSLSAHATPFTPRSPLSPGRTASPPPVNPELAALEAQKRQQLLARKAALLARKQQQALESDVDALFAAAPSPASSSAATKETRSARRNRKKRKLMAAQAVHDLRESVDHTEETVDVPSPGPFVVSANAEVGPSSRYNSVARSSAQPTSTFVPTSVAGRPKATDLEGEPAHAMSSASLSKGHAAPAYIASASTRMIIELSDDESEEEEQAGDGADEEMRDSTPSTSSGNIPSPSLAPSQPSRRSSRPPAGEADQAAAAAAAAEAAARAAKAELDERERKHRLEAKEREIQRMMERIAEMERRKKEAGSKKGESASPAPQPPPPVVANGHAALPIVEVQPNEGQGVDPVAATAPARATPTPAQPAPLFRPYQSSLSRYPLCRASAASDSASIPSFAPSADVPAPAPADSGKAGIASWVARKRGVDTSRRLCKAEAGGGRCHDTKCKSLHISSFVPTAEEVAEYEALERAAAPTLANDASQ